MFTSKPLIQTNESSFPVENNNYVTIEMRYCPDSPQPDDKLAKIFVELANQPNKKIVIETTQNGNEFVSVFKIIDE